jgi:acetyl-CoA carboxylase biotin carboxyl carrier protein
MPRDRARARGRGSYCARSFHDIEEAVVADVEAHITGTVWKIECAVGDAIEEGDTVAILESMKMEMPVEAEDAGTVVEIRCAEGQAVNEGDTLVVLE